MTKAKITQGPFSVTLEYTDPVEQERLEIDFRGEPGKYLWHRFDTFDSLTGGYKKTKWSQPTDEHGNTLYVENTLLETVRAWRRAQLRRFKREEY